MMQNNPSPWYAAAPEIIGTIVVIAVVLAINLAISGMLRGRTSLSRETKLRASVFWRNTSLMVAVVLLLLLWRSELRAAALSLAALSVALVLAGKELLTSMLGYIYRTTSGSFRFGDVIEISNVQGEVIDQTLLSTTLLEMSDEHQFTGRTVQFPNSFYITHPIKNHSRIGSYQLGILVVPLAAGVDVDAARRRLEQAAASVCAAFVAPAEVALRELEGEQFVVLPSAEPRVTMRLVDANKVNLVLRYPCPASQRTRTEQEHPGALSRRRLGRSWYRSCLGSWEMAPNCLKMPVRIVVLLVLGALLAHGASAAHPDPRKKPRRGRNRTSASMRAWWCTRMPPAYRPRRLSPASSSAPISSASRYSSSWTRSIAPPGGATGTGSAT